MRQSERESFLKAAFLAGTLTRSSQAISHRKCALAVGKQFLKRLKYSWVMQKALPWILSLWVRAPQATDETVSEHVTKRCNKALAGRHEVRLEPPEEQWMTDAKT